jgi:hypothetical protein
VSETVETSDFGTVECRECGLWHDAYFDHLGSFGEGRVYAVSCAFDSEGFTDFYTEEVVVVAADRDGAPLRPGSAVRVGKGRTTWTVVAVRETVLDLVSPVGRRRTLRASTVVLVGASGWGLE